MSKASQDGCYHEVSNNPRQYGEEPMKTNVSRFGGKMLVDESKSVNMHRNNTKGTSFSSSTGSTKGGHVQMNK